MKFAAAYFIYRIAKSVLRFYILLFVVIFFCQRWMVFPRGSEVWTNPGAEPYGWAYDDVRLDVGGKMTHGWWVPAPGESRGALLFCHGNAGTIADRMSSLEIFRSLGLDVLIFDYGGYGYSTGYPSETRCVNDAHAAWRFLTVDKKIPPEHVVIFGRSLGGAVAAALATEVTPGAVILESTFLSVPAMARKQIGFIARLFWIRDPFETDKRIKRINVPKLFIHSPEDDIVPFSQGKRLYDLAPEPKTFLQIRGGHNDGFIISENEYIRGLGAFLDGFPPQLEIAAPSTVTGAK